MSAAASFTAYRPETSTNEPFGSDQHPICSNILCEELFQIVRHLKDTGFQRGHRACLLDHDIMLLSLSVVQT
jgi:hypothetical protein